MNGDVSMAPGAAADGNCSALHFATTELRVFVLSLVFPRGQIRPVKVNNDGKTRLLLP